MLNSTRLMPHESETTDVILVGHSLGGILAAEVALIPSHVPGSGDRFQHRILGLVAFDTPFLGMHPGVVGTGIASLFRSLPELEGAPLPDDPPFSDPVAPPSDSTYNPSYSNDVHLANRRGKFQRAWYFWNKHAGELAKATGNYLSSHLEFGGCLADYVGLKRRYNAIRALENVDETMEARTSDGRLLKRVRFVNYYSTSTGQIKERPPSPTEQQALLEPPSTEIQPLSSKRSSSASSQRFLTGTSSSMIPRLSLEEHQDGELITKDIAALNIDPDSPIDNPSPSIKLRTVSTPTESKLSLSAKSLIETGMPLIPELPQRPPRFDPSLHPDEDSRKLFRKEHERNVKAYERALKDREKLIKERDKLVQKRERDATRQQEKAAKLSKDQATRLQKEQVKRSSTLNPEDCNQRDLPRSSRKQKDRKFCALPPKDPHTGKRDSTWVRVYMEGMDEVIAHTSMFKMSDTYAKMVRDTVERIREWVAESASKSMALAKAANEK